MSSGNPASLYATFTVIDSLILILTLLRLSFRWHIRRFWWEDAWAAAAFLPGIAFIVAQYVAAETGTTHHETGIIACWIASVCSTIAMCAVRMSILYSTVRIMAPLSHIRTFARIVAIFLFFFSAIAVVLRSSLCTNHITPKGTKPVTKMCIDGVILTVFQVTTDCISDMILVTLPLKLLWRVKLPRRQRRMILALFASSAIVSMFSLAHGVTQSLPNNNVPFNLTLNLETTSALIVCNLLVLVTYMYRVLRQSRGESVSSESDDSSTDDDFTTRTPARRTTEALTSVDLDIDASYGGINSCVLSPSDPHSLAVGKDGD